MKVLEELLDILVVSKVEETRAREILSEVARRGKLSYLGKGTNFVTLLLEQNGSKMVVKIEKDDPCAKNAARKEAYFLSYLNKYGLGPKLIFYDEQKRFLIEEFLEGEFIIDYLLKEEDSRKIMDVVLKSLVKAFKMDEIGVAHGQLHLPKRHIIVTSSGPRFLDFDKGVFSKKGKNLTQLIQFFFLNPKSVVRRKVLETFNLSEDDLSLLFNLLKEYKNTKEKPHIFNTILQEITKKQKIDIESCLKDL